MSGHPYLWVQYRAPANIANGTYYLRNKNSGLYLDVPNWGGSGTGLKQYSFNAGTNQKWKIEKQSNGLYTFKPMHNTNLAMDVYNALDQDGAAVWTYTANGSGAQEWYIIPNLDNTYRILSRCSNGWRGLVVSGASKAEGAEVFQYTYTVTENTNDDWYLEPTAHKAFSTIGITDAGHDHTSYMDRLSNPAACIGYSQWNQSIDTSVNNIEWYYDHSSYLVIRSHGAQNRIVLGDGDLTRSDVLSWSSSRLNDMRLVLYSACSTGAGGASADNLVNATFDRGAKTVIGFQDAVNCDQANTWTKEFFIAAGERGKSVGEACTDADYWVGVYHLLFHGGTDNRLIRGSTAQKLTS